MEDEAICSTCKEPKGLDDFYKDKRYRLGFRPQCKRCICNQTNDYAKTTGRDSRRRSSNAWTAANPERVMLNSTRQRAKLKGLDFSITLEDITIPETCPILGIPLCRNTTGQKGGAWNSPSLDRIDNTKGYVSGNVWVISFRANAMKSSASIEDLLAFSEWIQETYG